MTRWIAFAVLAVLLERSAFPTAETVTPNDNRHSAGTLSNGVLTVALEARSGTWYPEGEKGRAVDVAAFAEEGKPLLTPGPVIRAPLGTQVRVTIRNSLDGPLTITGFGARRGPTDTTVIAVGEVKQLSFTANTVGTYYYLGKRGAAPVFGGRSNEDAQLNGLLVIDPPNGKLPDRLIAITWWCNVNPQSRTGLSRCTMAMNGLSWPHTERLDYAQGDSVRWRVANFTDLDHPMHLHGLYFRTDARGDGLRDTLYTVGQRRMGVTEVLPPLQTMAIAWKAERPGNWIYHCHYAAHLSQIVALDTENGEMDHSGLEHHVSDRPHQMFGLVMGITIDPKGPAAVASTKPVKPYRMVVRERPNVYGDQPGMSFVLDGTPEANEPNALSIPAPTLVLERGQPVAVKVVNRTSEHAAVHWHGIELESYPDGVPGWSGQGKTILPAIDPGDSLTVRWTPPRAGSFMYHSHFNEAQQMGSGLYGPIIVVEPGQKFDPETDRILFFGTGGAYQNVVFGPFPPFLLNGKAQPEPMDLEVGTKYRFRLFNLAGDAPLMVTVKNGDTPFEWRAVAKDGYPLPPSQATMRPATLVFDPGEIYDYEFTPKVAGELTLQFGVPPFLLPPPPPPGAPPAPVPPPTITVPIRIR
jgi:FtsP/CotA-like multicopper oxidase with cupredoxin domain